MTSLLLMACLVAADPLDREGEHSVDLMPAELRAHVYRLCEPAYLGRKGDGADRAAQHIADAFRALNLKPAFGDSFFQAIPWQLSSPRADGKSAIGRNVAALIPGTDPSGEWIIVSAHFDHLGQRGGKLHPGADDNASGVAMLLELAEHFALSPIKPRRTICFLSCDLEESFLQGSTHFAAHPPLPFNKLKAFVVADIIGRSMADVMEEYVFVLGSESAERFRELLKEVQPEAGLKIGRLGADLVGTRSDYGPFRDRRVPFLFYSTGTHRDYHKPTDLPDRLDYDKLTRISRHIAAMTRRLAMDDTAPRWNPNGAEPSVAEVAAIRVLFDRLAERPNVTLTDGQRTRVNEARERLAIIESTKFVTVADRTWLLETARWAMLNLF